MIDAQLGPPVAVASRGGSAPPGGAAGDNATAARTPADDGGFTAALEGRTTPASSVARPAEAQTPKDAAGPPTGELQDEDAADAGASQEQTVAADVAAVIAAIVTAAVPAVASPTPPSGAVAGQQVVEAAQAAGPAQPIAGLVPAQLDGKGGVMPALTAVPAPTPTAAQAQAGQAQTPALTGAPAPAAGAPAGAAPPAAAAGPSPAPAATLTLTITPTPPQDATVPGAPAPGMGAPAVPAQATTPVAVARDGSTPATPAPQPKVPEAAPAAATTTDAPAGSIAPAPVPQPTHADPLGGIVRSGGGLTTPHELARELGSRVHMAVREGGRELVVTLRPAELGHLTIKVTMTDGVLQAHIIADRPEAARMLQQSLGHLDTALGDLGYSLDNLDVAYGGQDPRDAQSSSQQVDAPVVRGEVLEADGTPAVSGNTSSAAAGSSARLDILA